MSCAEQSGFLVLVGHGTHVAAHDFKLRILADIILGHLEHAEVKVGDGAEGATCDEDDRLLLGIAEHAREAVSRKGVVWRIREVRRRGR